MKLIRLVGCVVLNIVLACACAPASNASTPGRGPHTPRRIISLLPSVTEMLYSIGCGSRIVGDTTYCDYPPQAKLVSKIGDLNVNYERLLALHPDLVAADAVANRSAIARLRALHVPLVLVSGVTYAQVEDSIRTLGRATNTSTAASRVVLRMERQRAAAAGIAGRDKLPSPRVLAVIGTTPLWAAGRSTFIDDVIRLAGGVNVDSRLVGYGPVSREILPTLRLDTVVGSANDVSVLDKDPLVRQLAAYRRHRMLVFPDTNILSRSGPRLGDALVTMAHLLHPTANR